MIKNKVMNSEFLRDLPSSQYTEVIYGSSLNNITRLITMEVVIKGCVYTLCCLISLTIRCFW